MLEYKLYRGLIERYLEDEIAIRQLFSRKNFVLKVGMYADFMNWCNDKKPKLKYKSKDIFYEEVLKREEYYESTRWGKDFIVNTKIAPAGTGTGLGTGTVF